MIGFNQLALTLSTPGAGGGGAVQLPLFARAVCDSDSIFSQSVGAYSKSVQMHLSRLSGGRIKWAEAGDKGIPGTKLTNTKLTAGDDMTSRIPRVAEQLPDLVITNGGHNDNPSSAGTRDNVIAYHATFRAAMRAACPSAVIVYTTILPSSVEAADATALANLAIVNASIMAVHGTDGGKTICVDITTGANYLLDTDDGIHNNSTGARKVATAINAVLSGYYATQTVDQILARNGAQDGHGANLAASKFALPGTAGSVAGTVSPTGQVASTMLVTNNTTAAVACSLVDHGTYVEQVLTISGTVSVEGTVIFSDGTLSNRTSVSALPGEWFEALWAYTLSAADGVSPPVGLKSYGGIIPGTVSGTSLGNYLTADTANVIWNNGANSAIFVDYAVTTPELLRSYPFAQQSAATVYQNAIGLRLAVGTVDVVISISRPCLWRLFQTDLFAPIYVGTDFIKPTAQWIGLSSGTVANGNTLTFKPGAWAGGALSFGGVRIYSGGTSGGDTQNGSDYGGSAGIGTGTLLATRPAGTWTWTAAGMTSGTPLHIEVDVTNSFGTTTARSQDIAVP